MVNNLAQLTFPLDNFSKPSKNFQKGRGENEMHVHIMMISQIGDRGTTGIHERESLLRETNTGSDG